MDRKYFLDKEMVYKAVDDEPELPGQMPDAMWEAIKGDRDAMGEALRLSVSMTKDDIKERIGKLPVFALPDKEPDRCESCECELTEDNTVSLADVDVCRKCADELNEPCPDCGGTQGRCGTYPAMCSLQGGHSNKWCISTDDKCDNLVPCDLCGDSKEVSLDIKN